MTIDLLVRELLAANCLKFGDFKLKCGTASDYYIDFRESTLHPRLFKMIVDKLIDVVLYQIINKYPIDKIAIAGVPYGVVPIAAVVAHEIGCSYAPIRKETKNYGHTTDLEFLKDHRFILIEDVMSSGSSIIEAIKKLEGRNITDVVVLANREGGGYERLLREYPSIRVRSILKASDMIEAFNRFD